MPRVRILWVRVSLLLSFLALGSCTSVASPRSVDPDPDEDGVLDDRCPESAEDRDGFDDADGCPDPDNDGDALPDVDDMCPNDPEDTDGFQDPDGCPDLDNDQDRIPDAVDECPCHPEDDNGRDDADGCPDCGAAQFDDETLMILDFVPFTRGSAALDPQDSALLGLLAFLRENPDMIRIGVHGHAYREGDGIALSRRRAEAVRDHFVAEGIEAARLRVHHHGDRFPVAPDVAAPERSRRVDFEIEETRRRRELTCGSVPSVPDCGDGEARQRVPVYAPFGLQNRYQEEPVD